MKNIFLIITVVLFSTLQLTAQQHDELFFVFLNNNPDKELISEQAAQDLQDVHIKNTEKLAQEGKLIAAGSFEGGGGIFVLKAKDQFQAWDYLNTDPAINAKRYKVEVLPFMAWNGNICKAKEPYEMVTYQFVRLVSNPDFNGDENKMIHDNRIFMSGMFNNNPDEVLVYGFFSEFNDGMAVFNASSEQAKNLISKHPAINAGQLTFEIKSLYIAKGSFCE
jgi:uncharacterized protein YciI